VERNNKIEKGDMTEKGSMIVTGGKGRYADAKGDGTWEENTIGTGADAMQIIDNVLNIKKKRSHGAARSAG
jgi:hypothetical protein